MGVSWHSHAEVISLEPEKIKQLIEEIDRDDDYDTSSVNDLRIEDNSVFFNSGGYGCYGYDEGVGDLLFKILLEKYEGAIACFEYVLPCQSQDYNFAITYIQSETEQSSHFIGFSIRDNILDSDYDMDDENHEYDFWGDLQVDLNDSSTRFTHKEGYIWVIDTNWLENDPLLVSLNSIYKKWGKNKRNIITRSLIRSWWDDDAISDDEYDSAIEEFELYCVEEYLKYHANHKLEDYGSELPNNFPRFKTGSGS